MLAGRGRGCRAAAAAFPRGYEAEEAAGGSEETGQKDGRGRKAAAALGWWVVVDWDWIYLSRRGPAPALSPPPAGQARGIKERQAGRACTHVTEQFHSVWTHPRAFPLVARIRILPLPSRRKGLLGLGGLVGSDPEPVGLW